MSSLSPPESPRASIPADYLCPIRQELFTEGVQAPDGYTYEKSAIEQWLRLSHEDTVVSPLMGNAMARGPLVPNRTLMAAIASHPVAGPQYVAALAALKAERMAQGPVAAADASRAGPLAGLRLWVRAAVGVSLGLVVGQYAGVGLGGVTHRGTEFLFGRRLAPSGLGAAVGGMWGGMSTSLWFGAQAIGDRDASVAPMQMALCGLGALGLHWGFAAAGVLVGIFVESADCRHDLASCRFAETCQLSAQIGVTFGTLLSCGVLTYGAGRVVQQGAEWLGLTPTLEHATGLLRDSLRLLDAQAQDTMEAMVYAGRRPLPRVESTLEFADTPY